MIGRTQAIRRVCPTAPDPPGLPSMRKDAQHVGPLGARPTRRARDESLQIGSFLPLGNALGSAPCPAQLPHTRRNRAGRMRRSGGGHSMTSIDRQRRAEAAPPSPFGEGGPVSRTIPPATPGLLKGCLPRVAPLSPDAPSSPKSPEARLLISPFSPSNEPNVDRASARSALESPPGSLVGGTGPMRPVFCRRVTVRTGSISGTALC